MSYEMVSGLETHVELSTKTKIFCPCTTSFGAEPNTHCCPVCIGLPGTLPRLNRQVVRFAVMAGLALNCKISEYSKMDRKNYCYPDLPKAYQISQYDMPLCTDGFLELSNGKRIRINRIHIEEDAGKLVHRRGGTFIDYNRGGVPLIEIVTEPDIRSPEEAREYVEKLQLIMKYIGVSDCKMQEGSMRCDVNISVRKKGDETLGTRTEIKNMNSISFITKAMEYEFARQVDILESGGEVVQETLRYDDKSNTTSSMRTKEDANDYRYFREPDLVTVHVGSDEIEQIRNSLPELPDKKLKRYTDKLMIPENDARLICRYKRAAEFFDEAIKGISKPKTAFNFILGQIFRRLPTEQEKEDFNILISASQLNETVHLIESGKLSNNLAKTAFEKMLDTGKSITEFVSYEDLQGMSEDELKSLCTEAIEANASAVNDYKNGKQKAIKAILGYVMKKSRGKADAVSTQNLLADLINNG